jgi:hypothetical protein
LFKLNAAKLFHFNSTKKDGSFGKYVKYVTYFKIHVSHLIDEKIADTLPEIKMK